MRLKLTHEGLLVKLANHYTTGGAHTMVLCGITARKNSCFILLDQRMNSKYFLTELYHEYQYLKKDFLKLFL